MHSKPNSMKTNIFSTLGCLCLTSTILLGYPYLTFVFSAEETKSNQAIQILKNPLNSNEDRKAALNQLLSSPTEESLSVLLQLLKNTKETIPFRRMIAEGLVRLNRARTFDELERLLFNREQSDSLTREIILPILLEIATPKQKEILLPQLIRLAQDANDTPDLRQAAVGYLNNAGYIPEQSPEWAKKIVTGKNQPVQVRTSALNYMEANQETELINLLPSLIQNSSEDDNFRQIAILKAVRIIPLENFSVVLKTILFNQKENFEIRRLCLNLLLNEASNPSLLSSLLELLSREKNTRMQEELRKAITTLKNQ